jgi:hypothetical protein
MLNIDQIEDHLNAIYGRRRALNRAAAALNVARAVAHLRQQFPTAAYAWISVNDDIDTVGGRYTADIIRIHNAVGSCIWHSEDIDAKEIESPATDALTYAAEASESSIPTFTGSHPVAGRAPGTDSGDDPVLLVFDDVDKAAEAATWATEVTPVAIPQINNGHPTLVLFAVPSDQVTGIETFDQADAAKLGPPAVIGPDEFPAAPRTWTFFGHWENDRVVVEWYEDGEVDDDREDTGEWDQGLWAASAQGASVEEAQTAAIAEYETPLSN